MYTFSSGATHAVIILTTSLRGTNLEMHDTLVCPGNLEKNHLFIKAPTTTTSSIAALFINKKLMACLDCFSTLPVNPEVENH